MLSLVLFSTFALQQNVFAITNSYRFSSSSVSVEQGQTSPSLNLVAVKTKDSGSNTDLYVQIRPEGSKIDGSNPYFTAIKVNNIDVLSETNFSTHIFFPVVVDTYSTSSVSIPITFSVKQSAPAGTYNIRLVGMYESETTFATAQLFVDSASSQTPTPTTISKTKDSEPKIKGPKIIVTGLTLNPKKVDVNVKPVTAKVKLKNVGDMDGERSINLLVQRTDGRHPFLADPFGFTFFVPAGDTITAQIKIYPRFGGTWTVEIDDLRDNFTSLGPEEERDYLPTTSELMGKSYIIVEKVEIFPRKNIRVGDLIDIDATVSNIGPVKGTKSIEGFALVEGDLPLFPTIELPAQKVTLDKYTSKIIHWKQIKVKFSGLWYAKADEKLEYFYVKESKNIVLPEDPEPITEEPPKKKTNQCDQWTGLKYDQCIKDKTSISGNKDDPDFDKLPDMGANMNFTEAEKSGALPDILPDPEEPNKKSSDKSDTKTKEKKHKSTKIDGKSDKKKVVTPVKKTDAKTKTKTKSK